MSSRPPASIVIIGGGQAAVEAAVCLRKNDFDGKLTVVCGETQPPYQRPPLSKQLLAGKTSAQAVALRSPEFFQSHGIDLRMGDPVLHIDRARKTLHTKNGETLPYDRALIATGAAARRLEMEGAELEGVRYLRSLDDCLALAGELREGARLAIIGAGYIGMEVAATARTLGCEVSVLEMAPRILSRQVAPQIAELFESRHRQQGVDIRCATEVRSLLGSTRIEAVRVDGDTVPADVVVVGIGVAPEVAWLEGSGLCGAAGIEVDHRCCSVDPDIFAAGDVTLQRRGNGASMRVESVHNAVYQGRIAALAMLDKPPPCEEVPWFWSDQYDLRLQMAGFPAASDRTIMRHYESGMAVFYLNGADRITAVQCVGNPREFMLSKKLIAQCTPVDLKSLGDANHPLQECLT